jgi:hypothetical protein
MPRWGGGGGGMPSPPFDDAAMLNGAMPQRVKRCVVEDGMDLPYHVPLAHLRLHDYMHALRAADDDACQT